MADEIWKDVPGFEGIYRISNLGNIIDCKTEQLVSTHAHGQVVLHGKRKSKSWWRPDILTRKVFGNDACLPEREPVRIKSASRRRMSKGEVDFDSAFEKKQREKYDSFEEWLIIRSFVMNRDGFVCKMCDANKNLEVHHIVPRSDGGGNNPENLITLCRSCHDMAEENNLRSRWLICNWGSED